MGRIAGRFARVEPRRRVKDFVLELLSDLPRNNCWTIAEWAGEASPDDMQHLIGRATWDTDAVRDDVREYVAEHLHDDDPDRCRSAGLGDQTAFAAKPELAARMVGRFLDAGHRSGWVAGDELYGRNPMVRAALEARGVGSHEATAAAGKFRADVLAAKVPKRT